MTLSTGRQRCLRGERWRITSWATACSSPARRRSLRGVGNRVLRARVPTLPATPRTPASSPRCSASPQLDSVSAAGSRSAHSSGLKITPRPPSPIPTTGLIVSGDSSRRRARQGEAVTVVEGDTFEYGVPRAWRWLVTAVLAVGLGFGGLMLGVVGRPELLAAVAAATAVVAAVAIWNRAMRAKEVERFIRSLPDYPFECPTDLPIGQLVKITGHVTCGSIPLETSGSEGICRCVYASTQLYARRRRLRRWRLTSSEKLVADFYISDSSTGMRFLVRAGNGAKVTPFVESATVSETNREEKTQSWRKEQNQLRVEECCIREGDSASVIGVLRTNKDLLIVDPPSDSDLLSTGFKWWRCLFPFLVRGLILIGKESSDEVIYRV
ncbi:putative membrane protein At1g16860 [Curcuma longa]|uniref:putative membrane protein At1g16860 n=1 Tax=Curcuma longa TaxID=136217 RepID=UPI003D9E68BA